MHSGIAFPRTFDQVVATGQRTSLRALRRRNISRIRAHRLQGGHARAAGFAGECADDEYAACEGADVVVIATEWNQFRNLDLDRIRATVREPVIVDLRDVYEPADMAEKGSEYTAVGR